MIFEGFETLTAVGVQVVNFQGRFAVQAGFPVGVPATGLCGMPPIVGEMQPTEDILAGMMSWVDASVEFAPPAGLAPPPSAPTPA